ncbi:hypothetical protein AAIH46_18030 [Rhizobium sp. 0TCS1.26]|uniref:hypothetical protein n=1 Tax=Rhizobium sp. 0TCS1.26 TaxID=3142623 RepID=UPI003D2B3E31
MENALTVSDIIKSAGGPAAIQAELVRQGQSLTRDAIYKWQKTGIPDRYWPSIMALSAVGPADLYAANCVARRPAAVCEAAE